MAPFILVIAGSLGFFTALLAFVFGAGIVAAIAIWSLAAIAGAAMAVIVSMAPMEEPLTA